MLGSLPSDEVGKSYRMRNEFALEKSNGHKTRPSWLSPVPEAQRAVAHATADDAVHGAVHGAFMTLPRYTYTREDACDARAAQVTGWQSPGLALSPEEWTERLQGAPLHNEMPS